MKKENRRLAEDPDFIADSLKTTFVNSLYEAMEREDIRPSELARRIGKSRQYLSKILHEDRRVNFTIETMVSLAHALNRRLEFHVFEREEEALPPKRKENSKPQWLKKSKSDEKLLSRHGNRRTAGRPF